MLLEFCGNETSQVLSNIEITKNSGNKDCEDKITIFHFQTDVNASKVKPLMNMTSEYVKSLPRDGSFQDFAAEQNTLLHRKEGCLVY